MGKSNYRDYSLSYGEDVVASCLAQALSGETRKQYSIYAPLSRQEKGIDLLVRNNSNSKTVTVQVKESRIWINKNGLCGTFFNVFEIDEVAKADFYALVTMYPHCEGEKEFKMSAVKYRPLILIFTYEEMKEEFDKVINKNGKKSKMISHTFTSEDDVKLDRGFAEGVNTLNGGKASRVEFLLKNKLEELKNALN